MTFLLGNWLFVGLGFITGTALGSFVKVLADRSLEKKTFTGRSYCVHCQKQLAWYDLFPVLSFLFLGGKCRYCHKRIGKEYWLVEVAVGLLVAVVFGTLSPTFPGVDNPFRLAIFLSGLIFQTFFVTILVALAITDYKRMLIPDRIIIPATFISLGLQIADKLVKVAYIYYFLSLAPLGRLLLPPASDYFGRHVLLTVEPLFWALVSGLAIGGIFWLLILITRGRGMGGGDVKLGAFLGLSLGFPNSLVAVMVAFLVGALFSVGLIISGKKHLGQTIPFGPFLVLGGILALLFGTQIIDWYLKMM